MNTNVEDADCDLVVTSEDCNDTDASVVNTNVDDADCDLIMTSEDCDDADATVVNTNVEGADCDLAVTSEDCDDTNPESTIISEDLDCDGLVNENDNDVDGDGILSSEDCDDTNPESTIISEDLDCDGLVNENDNDVDGDGILSSEDCDDADALTVNDMDCDGVFSSEDCDDNDDQIKQTLLEDPECDNFYLSDNGVIILCPNADVGDTGYVSGSNYIRVDRFMIRDYGGWACTSGIIDMSNLEYDSGSSFKISHWDVSGVTNMSHVT